MLKVQKRSPLLIIRLEGSDKRFIPELLNVMIQELSNVCIKI